MVPSAVEEPITISYLLQTYILEPISTFFRFLHLALLFGPVILSSPMLLVGSTSVSHGSPGTAKNAEETERWGAIWWYGFLVSQMERAGPTFIKVRAAGLLVALMADPPAPAWSMGSIAGRPLSCLFV